MTGETYEILALKYADLNNRTRADNFLDPGDDHDSLMPMDYFLWVLKSDRRTIVVDTGFDKIEGARRGRDVMMNPTEALTSIGIDSRSIEDVVITHMHYDHAGTLGDFPNARVYVQDSEVQFCTGRAMLDGSERMAYTADHVKDLIDKVFNEQVSFIDGDEEIAPNVSLHRVPGHTAGMQCLRVKTKRGWTVLASDAAHYFENWKDRNPFSICWSMDDMFKSFDRIEELADSAEHVVPGHDPIVRSIYPAVSRDLPLVTRLDVMPDWTLA